MVAEVSLVGAGSEATEVSMVGAGSEATEVGMVGAGSEAPSSQISNLFGCLRCQSVIVRYESLEKCHERGYVGPERFRVVVEMWQ